MRIFNSENTAELINGIWDQFVGETDVTEDDTTSLVDKGLAISNSLTAENFRNVATGLFDRIGKIVFRTLSAEPDTYNINFDSVEYASMLEKVAMSPIEFEESYVYSTTGGSTFSDMFDYHALTFTGKVYNSIGEYRTKPYTISLKQLRSMFMNSDEMSTFLGAISNMVVAVYTTVKTQAEKRVVNTLASSCALDTSVTRIIDLLKVCKDKTGITYTTTSCMCAEFWQWAYAYMETIASKFTAITSKYNDGSRPTQTTKNDLRFVMPVDHETFGDMYAFTGAFNPSYIPKESTISTPCLQGIETPDKIHVRSELAPTKSIEIENIVGIMFDVNGAFICASEIESGTNVNDFDKHTNYVHNFAVRECVDSAENCVVFVIKDATGTTKAYTVTDDETT